MLEGTPKFLLPNFFERTFFRPSGVGSQTDQFEGWDYCVWGRACQLTNVGMGAGWVAYRANFSRGTPLSPACHRAVRALTLLTSDCGIRSVATPLPS